MTIRFLSILGLGLLLFSCKETSETNAAETPEEPISQKISENDISKINYTDYVLDSKTEIAIEDWVKYQEIDAVVKNVKQGDLSYFHDNDRANIIRNFFIALKKAIPDTINTPAISSRILVLETKTWKLESFANLSTTTEEELNQTIKEFLVSFSNLNLQMNKKLEKDSQQIDKP
ncbi:hypothetical protein APS56_09425 [Pseudalgibacter alginicilyticus]|uniref:DUF4468 domain-containing protein n=1 Tax=Pseudalgibacter alginicilyticus TaxID=1736674 RepID=A0A0P0DBM2_9FLAO|nr:hypothetical protein [Pseudalgibacter alginicilyticus]ALJ05331.1 hypothetical protein APS56_09425 [Pseudalgibacter alginicilyticus]